MNLFEFKRYFIKNYIGNKIIGNSLFETIVLNNDIWFTAYNTLYYRLQILGINIYKKNGYFYIESNNNFYDLKRQKLLKVNNFHPKFLFSKDILIDKINIKTEIFDNFTIKIPNLVERKNFNKIIIEKSNILVKIVIFDENLLEDLKSIIDIKSYNNYNIYFDLRECLGGNFNSMIKILEIFSTDKNSLYMFLENGEKNIKKYNIKTKQNDINFNFKYIISEKTASSAEIFLVCLKNFYGGVVYGIKSRGKFVIQNIIKVEDYIIAIPIYRFLFYKLNDKNIYNEGIVPEFSFNMLPREIKHILTKLSKIEKEELKFKN